MKNRFVTIGILIFCIVCLTGCGRLKGKEKLYRLASQWHGACEIVSAEEGENYTRVILRDELQNFQYTMSSKMYDISIDGSTFGTKEGTSDSFTKSLLDFIETSNKEEIDAICDAYEIDNFHINELVLSSNDASYNVDLKFHKEYKCEEAVKKIAKIFEDNNQNNRLDGLIVRASVNDDFFGQVQLPNDSEWQNRNIARVDYYMNNVHKNISRNAKFLRMEEGTFADTDLADLSRVVRGKLMNDVAPSTTSSPVVFYYFEVDGKEYYICNFQFYTDEDHLKIAVYSNYYE